MTRAGEPGSGEHRTAPAVPEVCGTDQRRACYVYGIVPGTTALPTETSGVSGERVYLVPYGDIAALASGARVGQALTQPENLISHKRLLDELSAHVPVLPLRFGTVLSDSDAVADLLLAPQHAALRGALSRLDGCAQYLVTGQYAEETVLREVLAETPGAAQLSAEIRSVGDANATRGLRIRLGQIVSAAITAKRLADTRSVDDVVAPCCVASAMRAPKHAQDAVNLALLARTGRQPDLEWRLSRVARDWAGRVQLRLVGPMAPYDFAQAALAGG